MSRMLRSSAPWTHAGLRWSIAGLTNRHRRRSANRFRSDGISLEKEWQSRECMAMPSPAKPLNEGKIRIDTLILLTTSQFDERPAELARLARSVAQFQAEAPPVTVHHYLLLQNAPACAALQGPWQILATTDRCSLSSARNRLLTSLPGEFLRANAIVAFPDDDAWYAPGVLRGIMAAFDAEPELDLLISRSGPDPSWPTSPVPIAPRLQQLISNATSNTLFVRGTLVDRIGAFDETLGLGTPGKSGEDTDYALRAFIEARSTLFLSAITIGHRAFDRRDREDYYVGALYAIARHASLVRGGRTALLRKLSIGVLLTLLGRMPPRLFWNSFRHAISIAFG